MLRKIPFKKERSFFLFIYFLTGSLPKIDIALLWLRQHFKIRTDVQGWKTFHVMDGRSSHRLQSEITTTEGKTQKCLNNLSVFEFWPEITLCLCFQPKHPLQSAVQEPHSFKSSERENSLNSLPQCSLRIGCWLVTERQEKLRDPGNVILILIYKHDL